jgi:hypothetical protein
MLDHLVSRESNKALSGDLLETFHAGRSAGWYWYQVIVAIAIAWGRNVWRHRAILIFAAAWSVFSPAWPLLTNHFLKRVSSFNYTFNWRTLAEPWSTVYVLGFSLMDSTLFIGLGIAIYSTLHLLAFRNLPLRSVLKGLLLGLVAFALAWVFLYAISIHYPSPADYAVHWKRPTVVSVIWSFGRLMTLSRIPYFIGTLTTLWFLVSRNKRGQIRAA